MGIGGNSAAGANSNPRTLMAAVAFDGGDINVGNVGNGAIN